MDWNTGFNTPSDEEGPITGRIEAVELVGTHLRMNGEMALGRFGRVSDYINSGSGYVRMRNARLLRRNGDNTSLVLPEIMVDQDEISFIAQADPDAAHDPSGGAIRLEAPVATGHAGLDSALGMGGAVPGGADAWGAPGALGGGSALDRPDRQFVLFTPGHTVIGSVKLYGGTDLQGFVDARDPRFVPVTNVTARSLADRRVISHFGFVLLNRTHMIAASEIGRAGDLASDQLPEL